MSIAAATTSEAESEIHERLDKIEALFKEHGHRMYGEAVSELQHAVQCAHSAQERGAPRSVIVAALLHDIGHLLHNRGENIADLGVDMRHEAIGEKYLRRWFSEAVSRPVGLHVQAKRYLCATEPGYLDGLSPASRQSLDLQGGVMTPEEVQAFVLMPYWQDALLLRWCDEDGKDAEAQPQGISTYRALVLAELRVGYEQGDQTGSIQN